MRNERRPSGSGVGAVETSAGDRVLAPRPHLHWSGRTAGPTYHRDRVEVAVLVVPDDQALALQDAFIATLLPEDNRKVPPWLFFRDEEETADREAGSDDDDGDGETMAGGEVPF